MDSHSERLVAVEKLLNASSVALIGASDRLDYGGRLLQNLRNSGYQGKVYPVNPKRDEVQGMKCFRDVREIPQPPDMAIIAIPAKAVRDAVEGCGQAGIRSVAIISAGFAELGGEGSKLQEELDKVAEEYGVYYTGPNSLGVTNVHAQMFGHASRQWDGGELIAGGLSIISQSGALGFGPIFNRAALAGIGLNKIVAVGNQGSLSVLDVLEYLVDRDPTTKAIGIYLEGLPPGSGSRLLEIGERAALTGKGIAVLKVGRSPAGRLATQAHTGSLGGDDKAYEAAFRQAGIIRAQDIDDIWLTCDFLAGTSTMDLRQGVAIMTNSGGLNSHIVDLCALEGVPIAPLADVTVRAIAERLGGRGVAGNPSDLSGQVASSDASGQVRGNPALADYVRYMAEDPAVDLTLLGLTTTSSGQGSVEAAQFIIDGWQRRQRPLVVIWAGGNALNAFPSVANAGYWLLRSAGIPVFEDAAQCMKTLGALRRRAEWVTTLRTREHVTGPENEIAWARSGAPAEELELIRQLGIDVVSTHVVDDEAEAASVAERFGLPVIAKLYGPALVHKSDVGAVKGPLRSVDAVKQAYNDLEALGKRLKLVDRSVGMQEFAGADTLEVLLSCFRDEVFGVVTMVGLGGIWVEALQDVACGVGRLGIDDARSMIATLRGASLFSGARGSKARDIDALCSAIVSLSRALEVKALNECDLIEINPAMLLPRGGGIKVVDARLTMKVARSAMPAGSAE